MITPTASVATQACCQDLARNLPDRVFHPRDAKYKSETKQYWSKVLRELKPACVIRPTTAAEAFTVVRILNQHPDVHFAVKSGGHSPNLGYASIDGGVLIALREIMGATYDETTGLASVKPGGTWNDVIKALELAGVTVVGGRLGCVGVGGYLLQGGLSFLSGQYGLAADNIVGWETVMPDGSIVNVDAATQPVLAVAMRGSGSQFGIVTEFKIRAHSISQVWGGVRYYSNSRRKALFSALHKFTPGGAQQDPKAAIIFSNIIAVGCIQGFLVFYFYDGATPPVTGPFADMLKIPSLKDQTRTRKYSSLLRSAGMGASVVGGRYAFRSFTIPYVASNPGMYNEISSKWSDIVSRHLKSIRNARSLCTAAAGGGGNAMGLSGSDPDRIVLEYQCKWSRKDDDEVLRGMAQEMTAWLESARPKWLAEAGIAAGNNCMPYFMNDAAEDQKVVESYRDYEKLKALQRSIDPDGLFRTRLGGFKY